MDNVVNMPNGDNNGPGVIRLLSGRLIDLQNPTIKDIYFDDIAWSLSGQIRYNRHIPLDYTVARHSIIMSYAVDEEHAMEALLHDAGEAYLSDVVNPLKKLFPEIEKMEDRITALIMKKYHPKLVIENGEYKKSDAVARADHEIYVHECWRFGRPDGEYIEYFAQAEEEAMLHNGLGVLEETGMAHDYHAFCHRFWELFEPLYEEII